MNIDSIKSTLEGEKKVLETELHSLGAFDTETKEWEAVPEAETSGPEADDNDLADRFEDFEDKSAKTDELQKRLHSVTGAIERIENGTYGVCRVCQAQIEPERLTANPAADTCIAHKEM
jgi:DnaK suppressor protein